MNHAVTILPGGTKLVIAVPHAGDNIPVELEDRILYDQYNPNGYDLYATEIFQKLAEHGPVVLGVPNRELIDYNRFRDAEDSVRGVLPEEGFHGNRFLYRPHTPEERETLLTKYWDEYQDALESLVLSQHQEYGAVLIIAGHTMESVGPQNAPDTGIPRPNISIGTLDGTLAEKLYLDTFMEALQEAAKELDVRVDHPYRGEEYITRQFGRPIEGFNIIQIEVNIGSYEDPLKKPIIDQALQYAIDALVNVFHS